MADRTHEPPVEGSAAEGKEFLYWVAQAARAQRVEAGEDEDTIALIAGTHRRTVTRFEGVVAIPQALDEMVCAYALACGLDDERFIYGAALEMWRKKGRPALPNSRAAQRAASYGERFAAAWKQVRQGQVPPHDEPKQKPTSRERRRGAG